MNDTKYIHELHAEHKTWLEELSFASDEIRSYENRLAELLQANNKVEITSKAEHFQNQFIRHNEVIDELSHDIREDEQRITEEAKANNIATDHRRTQDHPGLRDRMETFKQIFSELKKEFAGFLSTSL
jgi:uncharacterized coiled-coil DUF342 family protein